MPEEISSEEARAKVFDPQEAARIRQAIQEAQQGQPLLRAEQPKASIAISEPVKETKSTAQLSTEQSNKPTTPVRPPEIYTEDARAKIYTAKQLAAVREAIALEQVKQTQKPHG